VFFVGKIGGEEDGESEGVEIAAMDMSLELGLWDCAYAVPLDTLLEQTLTERTYISTHTRGTNNFISRVLENLRPLNTPIRLRLSRSLQYCSQTPISQLPT
jgi:hypothetical protein